jgi:hypothetical protein
MLCKEIQAGLFDILSSRMLVMTNDIQQDVKIASGESTMLSK